MTITNNVLTAFAGHQRVATGTLRALAPQLKAVIESDPAAQILIFNDASGAQVDLNLHGSLEQILQRLPREVSENQQTENSAPRTAGRPKLGVVAREVTLLPRHWEWLASQPGGASVALRKLVETAQRDNKDSDRQRQARDAAYQFMNAMAGDQAGFEEASRALFAGNAEQFAACIVHWPVDVLKHAQTLAAASFSSQPVP